MPADAELGSDISNSDLKARLAPSAAYDIPRSSVEGEAGGAPLALTSEAGVRETRSRLGLWARKGQVGKIKEKLTVQGKTMT